MSKLKGSATPEKFNFKRSHVESQSLFEQNQLSLSTGRRSILKSSPTRQPVPKEIVGTLTDIWRMHDVDNNGSLEFE